jgi:hypothetical protein
VPASEPDITIVTGRIIWIKILSGWRKQARKTIAAAISNGSPMRPIGVMSTHTRGQGVHTHAALRPLRGQSFCEHMHGALARHVGYRCLERLMINPDIEPRLTMLPLHWAITWRPKARQHQNMPLMLTSITARHSSSGVSTAELSRTMPTLLTRMSTLPCSGTIASAAMVTAVGSVTSRTTGLTRSRLEQAKVPLRQKSRPRLLTPRRGRARTGLRQRSNPSPLPRTGNWKKASRDRRPKRSGQNLLAERMDGNDMQSDAG